MPRVTCLPPSPDGRFFDVAVPDLTSLASDDPLQAISRLERERALSGESNRKSPEWLIAFAGMACDLGRYDEAIELCGQGFEKAFRGRKMELACDSLAICSSCHHAKGEFSLAGEVVSQLKLLAQAEKSDQLLATYEEAEGALHIRTVVRDWFASAREAYASALQRYVQLGNAGGQIRMHAGLASAISGYGTYLAYVEHVNEGLRIAAESDDWRWTGRLLLEAALALRDQGYRHNVEELFNLAAAWCEFTGDEYPRVRAIQGLAFLYDFEAYPDRIEDFEKSNQMFGRAIQEAQRIHALPLELQMRADTLHLYQKFNQEDAIARQRKMIDEIAAKLIDPGEKPWLESYDDYSRYIEGLRRDRFLARLRDGIEGIADPFFIFDPILLEDGTWGDLVNEFRNTAAANLLGIHGAAVRTIPDLILTPFFADLREPLLRAVTDRLTFDDELAVATPTGETIWYARRIVPAGDGAVVTFRDATNSRKVEETLRIAAESARLADRAKSEFLANMSHEVRTPIHGVLGLARLLAESNLDPVQQTYINGIISSGDILLRVIGDVLDVSKIEARRMEVNVRPASARRIVSEVVGLYRGQATERGIEIRGEVAEDVPEAVLLDDARIRQILGNLVGNAVKFTRKGSVGILLSRNGNNLEFEVQDTGLGLPPNQLEAIFRPFHQAAGGESEGGTGLGLTISKRLAELMGGDMTVSSEHGVGSRFSFRIPLAETEHLDTNDLSGDARSMTFEDCRVLLVEDNPVNVLVAKGLLAKLGCVVAVVNNGRDAVQAVQNGEHDIALMDVRMPVLDGLAATREIRANEGSGRHIPIVALTAGTLIDERSECFEAGMDDYLAKPFTLDALRATLSRWKTSNRL